MTHLSVNVNKIATLRNSRGKNLPNLQVLAAKILSYGVQGLTVHPRPDGRHIRIPDVWALKQLVEAATPTPFGPIEFNIEGFPSADFLKLIEDVRPNQATLVPDPPEALTSNAGWDLVAHQSFLEATLQRLRAAGVRSSLFIDPFQFDKTQKEALATLRPDRIELYTERFSDDFHSGQRQATTDQYVQMAVLATELQIGVNAGHDLNQENLSYLVSQIPAIKEVSIGHAIFCEALEQGLETTVANYLRILKNAKSHNPASTER